MHRRGVLRAAGVAATVGVAGCLGYTVESTDDVEQRKQRIRDLESQLETKESELQSLNETIAEKESKIEDLEASVENKDEEIASLESELETKRKEQISTLYALGDRHRQRAAKNWQDASGMYEQGDYPGASNEWGLASGQYIDAAETFEKAASVADEQGLSDVADKITSSKEYVRTSATVANHFALASYYYAHENKSRGDQHIDEGNATLDELQQYTLHEPSEIDSDLGL